MTRPPTLPPRRSFAVAELGGSVDDLIKGREDIIGKLGLDGGLHALSRSSDRDADNALLCQGCVEHPLFAKFLLQARGAPEHATETDIFAEAEDAVRRGERGPQRRAY